LRMCVLVEDSWLVIGVCVVAWDAVVTSVVPAVPLYLIETMRVVCGHAMGHERSQWRSMRCRSAFGPLHSCALLT